MPYNGSQRKFVIGCVAVGTTILGLNLWNHTRRDGSLSEHFNSFNRQWNCGRDWYTKWNEYRLNGRRFANTWDMHELERLQRSGLVNKAANLCDQLIFVRIVDDAGVVKQTSSHYPSQYEPYAVKGILTTTFSYQLGLNVFTPMPFDTNEYDAYAPNSPAGLYLTTIDIANHHLSDDEDDHGNQLVLATIDLRNTQYRHIPGRIRVDRMNVLRMVVLNSTQVCSKYNLPTRWIKHMPGFREDVA
jgi:hypothetical protein